MSRGGRFRPPPALLGLKYTSSVELNPDTCTYHIITDSEGTHTFTTLSSFKSLSCCYRQDTHITRASYLHHMGITCTPHGHHMHITLSQIVKVLTLSPPFLHSNIYPAAIGRTLTSHGHHMHITLSQIVKVLTLSPPFLHSNIYPAAIGRTLTSHGHHMHITLSQIVKVVLTLSPHFLHS